MLQQELYNLPDNFKELATKHAMTLASLRKKVLRETPLYKVLSPTIANFSHKEISEAVGKITSKYTDVVIISMGGANLNPALLLGALQNNSGIDIHFLDSTEPGWVQKKLIALNLDKTAILTISKSGSTLETISILAAIISEYDRQGIDQAGRYFFITNKSDGRLLQIANELKGMVIEHDQDISGRYSGLSSVTLLPALLAGIDVDEYIHGAIIELEDFIQNDDSKAILSAFAMHNLQKNIHVNVIYDCQLKKFTDWQSQILAESLGKQNKGFTPLASKGPEDQHSMYQLYLDGPDDKFYSYYTVSGAATNSAEILTDDALQISSKIKGLEHIHGMTLSKIHRINENASFEALRKKGRPIRKLLINNLCAKDIGSLVALSMIEVILLGEIMGINPFNQEGVELIKKESRAAVGV